MNIEGTKQIMALVHDIRKAEDSLSSQISEFLPDIDAVRILHNIVIEKRTLLAELILNQFASPESMDAIKAFLNGGVS